MKNIQSYKDFISDSLKESLELYPEKKFKIGDIVRVGEKTGKIISMQGEWYSVFIGSSQRKCRVSELKELSHHPNKEKSKIRKKKPVERSLSISD